MANELIYSDVTVDNSITNPDVDTNDALDNTAPFSFFDFLKYTSATYTPSEYNTFYTSYLTNWSAAKESTVPTATFIAEQYIDLLKDISLNYTTEAEKRFLTQIDFENPLDLDVAIPFYTKKIKEIILFYKQKRDTGTFVIERNKIKGTTHSLERAIYDTIVSYLFSDDSIKNFSLVNYNIEQIKRNLGVNVCEFIDVYTNYFDLPRTPEDETSLREELYTYNTNAIDSDLFFNKDNEITKQIFGDTVRLKEIPIAVNTSLDYNPICAPTNPLESLVTSDEQDLLGADERVALRQRFYAKYLGTDFYYLSTNAFIDSASGRFIEADNPSGNLLNLQTADIAGVESTQLEALRNIGLFFKPDRQGILRVSSQTYKYEVNTDLLEPDTIYIFPNPDVYGNVSLNQQDVYPLIYTYNIRSDVRNATTGFAYGDPKVESDGQPFLPYYSRQQNKDKFKKREIYIDMSDLYNEGIIQKWQTDVYGNQYAIFKDRFGQYFLNELDLGAQYIKCLTLDGHVFFDLQEGYNFDYSIYQVVDENTIRSGLSSKTVTNQVSGTSFSYLSSSPLYLNFRQIFPYQDCGFVAISALNQKCGPLYECGYFTKSDSTALPDPVHADLSSYPVGYYYYDYFLGGGIGSVSPLSRALIDTPTLSADFTLSLVPYFSSADAAQYNCGYFTDIITICDSEDNKLFIDDVDDNSKSVLSSLSGSNEFVAVSKYQCLTGAAYVRPVGSTNSITLSSALSALITKYNGYVQSQVTNYLTDFDIIYDSIFLLTDNVLLIDKISYDGSFNQPTTKNTFYLANSTNQFSKFSNRFFREDTNTVTFVLMEEFPTLSGSPYKIVYPNIYRYDIPTNKTKKLWPTNTAVQVPAVSSFYSTGSALSANMVTIGKPKLAYNSKNDVWKLTYVAKDVNAFPHVFDITLKERNTYIETIDSKLYTLQSKPSMTTTWASPSAEYTSLQEFRLTRNPTPALGIYYIRPSGK